jgi:RimJ/RimL family protein N-acetyltransferase
VPTHQNEYGQPIGAPVVGWTPRAVPGGRALVGSAITVRPLELADATGLFAATCSQAPERWTYLPQGPFTTVAGLIGYLEPMWAAADHRPMALVDPSGAVLGTASFMRIAPELGTVEVGSIMYGPALARTRAATEAMTLMARHVFEELGYRRYEWKCDALNAPSRSAAQRLGFTFEGVWRNALVTRGRNRDTAWYAMTDRDWARLAPAHAAWLAETEGGPQRRSLSSLTRAALDGRAP